MILGGRQVSRVVQHTVFIGREDFVADEWVISFFHPSVEAGSHVLQCVFILRIIGEIVGFRWIEQDIVESFARNVPFSPPVVYHHGFGDAVVAVGHDGQVSVAIMSDVFPSVSTDGPLRFVGGVIVDFCEGLFTDLCLMASDQRHHRCALQPFRGIYVE